MGFWNNLWESTKSAVSSGYRAFTKAVSYVGSKIVEASSAAYDYVKEKTKKAIYAAGEFIGKVSGIFREGYNQGQASVLGDNETIEYINELEARQREFEAQKINYVERIKGEEQVKQIFRMVRKMTEIQYENKGTDSLEVFQNYTRHYVSAKFLQDLLSQREEISSPADIDLVFLSLIQKFLTNSISVQELEELDKQIQQLYDGKDLLIIGTEALADIWQHQSKTQLKELRGLNKQLESSQIELNTKADRIRRREKNDPGSITDEERNNLEELRKSVEILKKDISNLKKEEALTTEMMNILNGINFVFQHENDGRISTAMREEAVWVGSEFVKWQDTGVPPAPEDRSRLSQFGLAVKVLMKDLGISGTIDVQ
jgi:hypothetical protein